MNERTSGDIERDIERTRAEMSHTIDAIQERLSPGQLVDQAFHYFQSGSGRGLTDGASQFAQNLGRAIRDNPVPVALVATGVAWLMVSRARGPSSRYGYAEYDELEELEEIDELERDWSPHYGPPAYDAATPYDDRPEADRDTHAPAGVGPSSQAGGMPRPGVGDAVAAAAARERAEEGSKP